MITEVQMAKVLDQAVASGADFAELFFEEKESTSITMRMDGIQGVNSHSLSGVGLYVLKGTESVYLYTNRRDYDSLMELAQTASGLICPGSAIQCERHVKLARKEWKHPSVIRRYPLETENREKIRRIQQMEKAAAGAGPRLLNLDLIYSDFDQRILVANTEGLLTPDRRTASNVRFYVTVGDEKGAFGEWEDFRKVQGFDEQSWEECCDFGKDWVRRVEAIRKAKPLAACHVPVILNAGTCGTFWHECCGHGLEARAVSEGRSHFAGKLGKRIASERVTLIDDGAYPNLFGSSAIDDEGHVRQKNVLIENGVLRQYLCDRLHGRKLGMESNGCGRRQNYTFAPSSRMSNTYLAPGTDDEEEMIRSLPEGLFVKSMGGGVEGNMFSVKVKEAFWIKNGSIDHQVRGSTLSADGLEVLNRVDRVGSQLKTDMGGYCGADSGIIPCTTFQPMVRITEMAVGGDV